MIRPSIRCALTLALTLATVPALAQDDDAALKLAEPDFTLVSLPTSLRLPQFGSAFRVTHRFGRPLKCDECDRNLLEDLFGLDAGAAVGLEYRFGLVPNGQVVIHRSRVDRSLQFLGVFGITRQETAPVEVAAFASIEGTDNFQETYSPSIGLILTRLFGEAGALHLEPIWVGNADLAEGVDDDNTFMVGVGARVRIRPTVYLVGEVTPRLSGYRPGTSLGSFGIEKRAGGHMFQLNVSNYFGTTFRQIAQGAVNGEDWYLGFSISRKFF